MNSKFISFIEKHKNWTYNIFASPNLFENLFFIRLQLYNFWSTHISKLIEAYLQM